MESWQKKFDSEILFSDHLPAPQPVLRSFNEGGSFSDGGDNNPGHSDYILVKPQTFMNDSGKAVSEIVNFYKTDISKDLLIIHDDSDLPLGTIRTADSSSSAGHNGVQDIIDKLGTQNFHRIRIGVESRQSRNDMPTDAFVLQNFTADELKKLQAEVFPKVNDEIEKFIGNLKFEI